MLEHEHSPNDQPPCDWSDEFDKGLLESLNRDLRDPAKWVQACIADYKHRHLMRLKSDAGYSEGTLRREVATLIHVAETFAAQCKESRDKGEVVNSLAAFEDARLAAEYAKQHAAGSPPPAERSAE